MTEIDAAKISGVNQYKLLVGTVTPRPIALVTSLGPQGPNAAPFSFFNAVGSDPAMLCFSVGNKDEGAKDTVANIRECPEFVVHIVSDAIKDKMNGYNAGVDMTWRFSKVVGLGVLLRYSHAMKDLTREQPLQVPIPARTGYTLLPPELSDPDPEKALEKQNTFAKRNKERAAPSKA